MQANIFPLIIVDVDCDFRPGLALGRLDIGLDDVILSTGRYALGKFPTAIGHEFPLRLLTGGPPNRNRNASRRMLVRVPHCAINQGVVILGGLRGGLNKVKTRLSGWQPEDSKRSYEQERGASKHFAFGGAPRQLSSHRLPLLLPRLRLLRLSHLRRE